MARRRMIDPSIWDDEGVGLLSDGAFRLFVSCISFADDEGKLDGSVRLMLSRAFRFKKTSLAKVERLLREVEGNIRGFRRYTVDGREFIALVNWRKYQRVEKPQPSTIPDPPFPERSRNVPGTIPERSPHEKKVIEERRREENAERSRNVPRTAPPPADAPSPQTQPGTGLYSEPLAVAYVNTFLPGGTIPSQEQQRAYKAILWLKAHPCYTEYLGTPEMSQKAFKLWQDDHPDGGRKPLTYIAKWIAERLTERGQRNGLLAEGYVFEEGKA